MPRFVFSVVLLWFLLCSEEGWADACVDTNYVLTTQSQVNELGATGCDLVAGELSITDSPDIYNLEPLAAINEIQGALTVSGNTALLNLDGLVNVTTAGLVVVENNTIMTNIDGLGGLKQAEGLAISSNPKLKDVEGLAKLSVVLGDVTLAGNPLIKNLAGLESLERVGGALSIEGNDALVHIDALSSLVLIGSALTIKDNDALISIQGLSSLIARTTITVSGSALTGGSISPAAQQVLPGGVARFSVVADAGFYVSRVDGDCPTGSLSRSTYITGEIFTECSVVVSFTATPTFTISASAGTGGSITPPSLTVEEGEAGTFTITPDEGFSLVSIGGTCPRGALSASTYLTGGIESDCTVTVSFTDANPTDYCSGTPAGVICDPNADGGLNPGGTLDSWAGKTWGFENTPIPNGKIVAYPFLANAGGDNLEGFMTFTNNMPDLTVTDYHWKGWFSETPGGETLNNGNNYCQRYSPNPNPQEMRWSQASSPNKYACDLGQAERVLYFNMEVGCYEELLASTPESERRCTVGAPFPGIGGYSVYYVKVYPR